MRRCERIQLGAIEDSVIIEPASHLRVDVLGEAGQVSAASTIQMPGSNLLALCPLRFRGHGRREAEE